MVLASTPGILRLISSAALVVKVRAMNGVSDLASWWAFAARHLVFPEPGDPIRYVEPECRTAVFWRLSNPFFILYYNMECGGLQAVGYYLF